MIEGWDACNCVLKCVLLYVEISRVVELLTTLGESECLITYNAQECCIQIYYCYGFQMNGLPNIYLCVVA